MKVFINDRPVVILGISLALGILLGNILFRNNMLYVYAAIISFAMLALVIKKRIEFKWLVYCLAFLIGILSISAAKGAVIKDQNNFYTGTAQCKLYVLDVTKDENINIIANDVTLDGKTYDGKVILRLYGKEPFDIQPGQTIELTAEFYKPKSLRNPYGFDYNFYLMQKGIAMRASADADTCKLLSYETLGIRGIFIGARSAIEDKITELYGDNAGVVKGILLGDKTEISESVIEDFRVSGIAHILAISGLHIGILVVFLLYLLRLSKLNDKSIMMIIFGILLCYCAVTNFSASIVRASIMAVLVLGAKAIGKRQDTLTSLFAAGFIILLVDPFSLFNVGFQLSFSAVLGILFVGKVCLKLFKKLPRYLREGLATLIGAQSGIFLVSAYYFYNVSVYSLFANILILPFVGVLVIFAFLSVALGLILSIIALPIVYITNILLSFLTGISAFVSSLPYASIVIGRPPLYVIAIVFIIMFVISDYFIISNYHKLTASLLLLVVMLGCVIYSQYTSFKGLKVIVFDVGQGDSAYIQTPSGYNILIDGGPVSEYTNAGETALLPFFYASATSDIDLVIASHAHSDHVGGLISVAKNLTIENYLEPSGIIASKDDTAYTQLKNILNSKGVVPTSVKAGDIIEFDDGVKIEIIYPYGGESIDDNDAAIVAKITYGEFSMVFTSDISAEAEKKIYKQVGSVNVLKVAHHGSKYSSGQTFLDHTTPQIAIISVGGNSYGHPAQEAIDRLTNAGANIYRTDQKGAVIIKVYENEYTIDSMIN